MTTSQLLAAGATKPSTTSLSDVIPLLLLLGVVFFFFSSSRRRQGAMAQRQAALAARSFAEGDEVVTQSGIIGRITAIEGDRVWLELDAGVIVEFMLAAVQRKIEPAAPPVTDRADRDATGGRRAGEAGDEVPDAGDADDEAVSDVVSGAGDTADAEGVGSAVTTGAPADDTGATASGSAVDVAASGSGGAGRDDTGASERDETYAEADRDATLQAERDATGWTEPAGGELRDSETEEVGSGRNTAGRQEGR